MNAWQIYLVMQLDNIGCSLAFLAGIAALTTVVCLLTAAFMTGPYTSDDQKAMGTAARKIAKKSMAALVATLLVGAFIPSTKTAAAMLILPAIVNNEAVQQEAGEMYQLAKQALASAAGVKPAPKKDPKR